MITTFPVKLTVLSLVFLAGLAMSCSESSSSTPTPTPTPTPDYSTCRYAFRYSLRYSPLSKTKPTTITYLDSTQKAKTVTLMDTSFAFTSTYKYGDSISVKLSPSQIYFLTNAQNRISISSTINTPSTSSCPTSSIKDFENKYSGINRDSIPSSVFSISPKRIGY